jgi:2-polyprenyl-3-methyl-5-hydroxy-6-metoxy-1,4-benzoquinol methylase
MNSKKFAENYYAFQTKARGLLHKTDLERSFQKRSKWYRSRLRKFMPTNRDVRWLDLPCGFGNFLYFLRQHGYQNVSGYDLDPEQVRLAHMLQLPAAEGDAFTVLSDNKESYDCIAAIDFLEHLDRDSAVTFLELCHERLNPGGRLFLRVPCADGPFGAHDRFNDLTHEWSMTSNVLRAMLEMISYERIEILDERPQPYNIRNRFRLILFFVAKFIASSFVVALGLAPPRIWSTAMWGVARKPSLAPQSKSLVKP